MTCQTSKALTNAEHQAMLHFAAIVAVENRTMDAWNDETLRKADRNARVLEGRGDIVVLGQKILALRKDADAAGLETTIYDACLAESKEAFKRVADLPNKNAARWGW